MENLTEHILYTALGDLAMDETSSSRFHLIKIHKKVLRYQMKIFLQIYIFFHFTLRLFGITERLR